MNLRTYGRFDSVSLAGLSVFGALSVILAYLSQLLGLNFPLIPYLQFDLGEVAIVIALFMFGPLPALVASFVEFIALMALGQNVPIGPILKLIALVSSIAGIWFGITIGSKLKSTSLSKMFLWSTGVGAISRAAVMTLANYYLLVFIYTIPVIAGFVSGSFKIIGVGITDANALFWVLALTGVFNVLQLSFVMTISYFVLRLPQVSSLKAGGKEVWYVNVLKQNTPPSSAGTRTSDT